MVKTTLACALLTAFVDDAVPTAVPPSRTVTFTEQSVSFVPLIVAFTLLQRSTKTAVSGCVATLRCMHYGKPKSTPTAIRVKHASHAPKLT